MKTFAFILILVVSSFCQGPVVRLNDKVTNFKHQLENKNVQSWSNGNLSEYQIVQDETLGGIRAEFEKEFQNLPLKNYRDNSLILNKDMDTVQFVSDIQNKNRKTLDLQTALSTNKIKAQKHLRSLGNQVEFDNYSARYLNNKLYKVELRYRRVFAGGIVRDNVSFIELTFDKDGNAEKVEAKWPAFVKIESKESVLDGVEIFNLYNQATSSMEKAFNDQGDTISVDSVTAIGSAFAWKQVNDKITPALSVIQEINFGKEKVQKIVDVPFVRKYSGN